MPSKVLLVPFVLALFAMLYLSIEVDESYNIWIIVLVVIVVGIFVFGPQIDWWWYKRYPPDIDPPLRELLQQRYPFYQDLSKANKLKFRQRTALIQRAKDFMPQGAETVPEDIKFFVAASQAHLTLGQEEYLLPKFEKIIIYTHPFPSPQYPERFHSSEIFTEDGVIMFSAQHLAKGFVEPTQYFPVGIYEMAKVFLESYPDKPWPELPDDSWERLERISGVSQSALTTYINLDDVAPLPVSMVYFMILPERFRSQWPELFTALNGILSLY